MKLTASF